MRLDRRDGQLNMFVPKAGSATERAVGQQQGTEALIGGIRMDDDEHYAAGMAVRRQILGDAWVDKAAANSKPYNKDFQNILTRYGWGEVWTRPGLSHHTRRVLVLGTMIALGKWDEFRMHARPALMSGNFTLAELTEVVLQQAIYCGLPAANTAFHHLAEVLEELEKEGINVLGAKN